MKHKILLTGLMLLLGLTISAQQSGTCGENLTWTLENGTLTISGTGEMENYQEDNYAPWYSSRSSITSVTISDGVTSIGNYAFYNCSSMTSVTIPNSVTSIGERAFFRCSSLTSVTIGNSVTSIEDYAFEWCSSLTSVTIPNSVTSIGEGAFLGCSSLTSVTIPNSVTSIGSSAFYGCSSLTSVTIPNSVTSIVEYAFAWCSSLTSITCEAVNPPACGNNVFYNVDKSIPLYVPASSMEAYKEADEWKEFTNRKPLSAISTSIDVRHQQNASSTRKTVKVLREGVTYILMPDGRMYDLQGKEVR